MGQKTKIEDLQRRNTVVMGMQTLQMVRSQQKNWNQEKQTEIEGDIINGFTGK